MRRRPGRMAARPMTVLSAALVACGAAAAPADRATVVEPTPDVTPAALDLASADCGVPVEGFLQVRDGTLLFGTEPLFLLRDVAGDAVVDAIEEPDDDEGSDEAG